MFLFLNLNALTKLEKIYHGDYGEIVRTVIVLDKKSKFNVELNKANKQILIKVPNCAKVDMKQEFKNNSVIDDLMIYQENDLLSISINTKKKYEIRYFPLTDRSNNAYKLVLDIFNTMKPVSLKEKLSFAKYYPRVGFDDKALRFYAQNKKLADQNTWIYYKWGKILKSRKNYSEALKKFRKVNKRSNEYNNAQSEIKKILALQKSKEQKDMNKPSKEKPKETKTEEKKQPEPSNLTNLSRDTRLMLNYYRDLKSNAEKYFLLGVGAEITGNYDNALKYLKSVDKKSDLIELTRRHIYEVYQKKGDENNAKLIKSLLVEPQTEAAEEESLLTKNIDLWLTVLIALFAAIVGVLVTAFIMSKKIAKNEPEFTNDDVKYHEEKIKESFEEETQEPENQESETDKESSDEEEEESEEVEFQDFNEEEMNEEPIIGEEEEEEEEIDFGEETEKEKQEEAENDENFEEELTSEEEEELLADEEESEKESQGVGDEEYQKKMIKKLAEDGWDVEAIAKELKLSQREVEFALKMDEEE